MTHLQRKLDVVVTKQNTNGARNNTNAKSHTHLQLLTFYYYFFEFVNFVSHEPWHRQKLQKSLSLPNTQPQITSINNYLFQIPHPRTPDCNGSAPLPCFWQGGLQ
jgi:hypothetical protein